MSNKNQQTSRPVHVDVDVVSVSKSKWATAVIRKIVDPDSLGHLRSSESIPPVKVGDKVSVHPKYRLTRRAKDVCCGIIRNQSTNSFAEKWFAVYCSNSTKMTKSMETSWCWWQNGENALVLSLPSTKPESSHDGINLACWKCGNFLVDSDEIYCIDKTCVWTYSIDAIRHSQFSIDKKKTRNLDKKCYVQTTRCSMCESILGSFYEKRFVDCTNDDQEFPCFKLITAWERSTWQGNVPTLATTLVGDEFTTRRSISNLDVTDNWEIEKDLLPGGKVDQSFCLVLEIAEIAKQAMKEAEVAVLASKQAQDVAAKRTLEAYERARQAELASKQAQDVAIKKTLEAEAARQEKEETEFASRQAQDIAVKKTLEAEAARREKEEAELASRQAQDIAVKKTLEAEAARREKEEAKAEAVEKLQRTEIIWECHVDGAWKKYPEHVSNDIEGAYKRKKRTQFTMSDLDVSHQQRNLRTGFKRALRCFKVHGARYEIDFECGNLTQVNIETGTRRAVRRRDTVVPVVPSTWTNVISGGKCELVPIVKGNDEWTIVEQELKRTIPNASLYSLQRVQNYSLWDYFSFQQARVGRLSANVDPNLTMVWHGTRGVDPKVICQDEADGFMMQFSNKGSWGQGLYFAQNASYSDGYAHIYQSSNGHALKTLIYVNLIVGDEIQHVADSSLRRCPEKEDGTGRRYHTVTGHANNSKIYIVYENGRGYPSYLVTYT